MNKWRLAIYCAAFAGLLAPTMGLSENGNPFVAPAAKPEQRETEALKERLRALEMQLHDLMSRPTAPPASNQVELPLVSLDTLEGNGEERSKPALIGIVNGQYLVRITLEEGREAFIAIDEAQFQSHYARRLLDYSLATRGLAK